MNLPNDVGSSRDSSSHSIRVNDGFSPRCSSSNPNRSLSFAGFMQYHLPVLPHNLDTYKEGLLGALTVAVTPFILFWLINKIVPSLKFEGGK